MAYLGRPGATAPLTSADIPDNSITAAKIVADTIAAGDLAPNSVDSSELVDGSIDTAHIGDDQVTADKLHTNAVFASGTKMIFNQTAAPTGWTKVTGSGNDHALRVTTGTVGTGGDVDFETAFASVTPTISQPTATSGAVAAHTLTKAELPAHYHTIGAINAVQGSGSPWAYSVAGGAGSGQWLTDSRTHSAPSTEMDGDSHTHNFTQPTISAVNLNVKFVDIIIATKD